MKTSNLRFVFLTWDVNILAEKKYYDEKLKLDLI